MTEAIKPDCYTCRHRGTIPGNAHSTCTSPLIDPVDTLIFMITGKSGVVEANEHGLNNGWFFWPYNFDPVWLESCKGYEKK